MILQNLPIEVYDIEVLPNIIKVTCKNTETKEYTMFEISKRKFEVQELVDFFTSGKYFFCGYNNKHYDDPIINYIIDYKEKMVQLDWRRVCTSVKHLSDIITANEDDIEAWKKWKYANYFKSFDLLTMLFSSKLRVGLKEMQMTMHYDNVEEFMCDWNSDLEESRFDELERYNINDVDSTEELLNRCKDDIDLRVYLLETMDIDCLSKDNVNMGMQILAKQYCKYSGKSWSEVKDLRSPMDTIPLKDVILPIIKYDDKNLQSMLERLKRLIVSPGRKGYSEQFIFAGLKYSLGVGGIHSVNTPEIIIPKEDELLIDSDVASLYPSMILKFDFYPRLLGEPFKIGYQSTLDERLEAKRDGNKSKNIAYKYALNGVSGNMQNKHSFCYDPLSVMRIRMNGQLLILMLAEKLVQVGCKIIQANTDGLLYIAKKNRITEVESVKKWWQDLTQLTLEDEQFKSFYQYAINDYFGVLNDGTIKQKGMFITKSILGKGLSPKIIPKAIIAYFTEGKDIHEFVHECTDIRDFLMGEKTGKQWHVEYYGKPQQRTNRYYASTNGAYLYKWKYNDDGTKEYQNMLTASGVTILNKLENKPMSDYKINYRYYITEIIKIIDELKPRQLSLFDQQDFSDISAQTIKTNSL